MSSTRRRTLKCVLAALCCAAPAHAQFNSAQQPSSTTYVLTGTVVNSLTGAPVPFALVQAADSNKLADQNGNFRFENLTSNNVMMQAHKPGYFSDQELGTFHTPTMVTLSDHPTSITIQLTPEAVITGHVENPEGQPLSNLPVRLRFGQINNGRRIWQQQGHRQTDEDGNFRIAELRPGTYYVEVGPNQRARALDAPQVTGEKFEVVPSEYYPGVREMSDAAPLQLIAGQHVSLEFAMKRVPAFRISGVMTGASGDSGSLALLDRDGENVNIGVRFDGRSGRFNAFPVPSGSYRLRYNGRAADGQQLFAEVPINVTGDIPELRVPVERTIDIPVQVETEFTQQNPRPQGGIGSGLGVIGPMQRLYGQIHLTSRSSPNRQFYAGRQGPESAEMIRGVEPGSYDVEVDTNGMSYVASATCGGVNVLRDPLVIAEGADPQPIEVVLRDDGASLNGAVQIPTDSAKSVQVLMVPTGDSTTSPRQVWVSPTGSFQAQGIPPGDYDILAFDRLDGLEYRNREVLSAYLSHAAHVTLSAGEQAKVTVDLIQAHQ